MDIRRNGGGSHTVKNGDKITVDWYLSDDEDVADWMEENSRSGIGLKVVDFNAESYQIWVEGCPYAIDATICVKD